MLENPSLRINRWKNAIFGLTFGDEEIQYGQRNRMATKHIITACANPLNGHAETAPYRICP